MKCRFLSLEGCFLISYSCQAKILQLIFEKLLLRPFAQISFEILTMNKGKVGEYSDVCKITIALLVFEILKL